MGTTRNTIVKQAIAWLGKNEKDGSFKTIIDTYNNHKPLPRNYKVKYTDEWCATTISALGIKCNATDIVLKECSCQKMIELHKKNKTWMESDGYIPKPGDILFYDWQDSGVGDNTGWSDHVGIVEKISGNDITVIEGNMDGKVNRRKIIVNGRYIRGYAVPKYTEEKKPSAIESYSGYITVLYNGLATHKSPSWDKKTINGTVKKGSVHTIVGRVKVDGVYMYKLKSGAFITSAIEYVKYSKTKPSTKNTLKTGSKVKIKSTATKYISGQKIPAWAKNKTYTVYQVKNDNVLLKEIMSWVKSKDITVQ